MCTQSSTDQERAVSALGEVGVHIGSIWDLVSTRVTPRNAIPVLINLLPQAHDLRTKEGVVSEISLKEVKEGGMKLIDEFKKLDTSISGWDSLGWSIGNALSVVVRPTEGVFEKLVEILREKRFGAAASTGHGN